MKTKREWTVSDISDATYLGCVEIQMPNGELNPFEILQNTDRLIFGGACNTGFLESGFIRREAGETTDDTLQELVKELEAFYFDGPDYVARLVHNERM